MELRSRFVVQLRRMDTGRVLDLPPGRVADAVRTILGLPGAGIVMMDRLVRLPVGAAGAYVPEAEQLQVTLGEGPCLRAAELGEPLVFTEADLARSWPVYHSSLVRRTPYRSVLSLPLKRPDGHVFAALDAYSTRPVPELAHPVDVICSDVGEIVSMLLLGALSADKHLLTWPPTDELRQRQQVWIAVGMVLEAASISDLDALAVLRGYAFRTGQLLDVVVGELVGGRLSTDRVLATG